MRNYCGDLTEKRSGEVHTLVILLEVLFGLTLTTF